MTDTLNLIQEGRTPILLTERKEHAALLASRLSDKVKNVFLLIGSDKQKEKREKMAALQNVPDDEDVVVVATGKYIGMRDASTEIMRENTKSVSMITWISMFRRWRGCIINA